jgi:hypothetical protein
MRPFLTALFLALLLSASGCSGLLIHQAMNPRDSALTPEQIKAYADVGADVWSCAQIVGPPPSGSLVMITTPKTSKTVIVFGDGCRVK